MLSGRPGYCCALAALVLVAALAAGCGKKGDPIPPRLMPMPVMADLTAEAVPEGIRLRWAAPGTIRRIDHFRIVRSDASAEAACPGCPQEYRPLASLRIDDPALQRAGEVAFGYLDGSVAAGRFYSYRVSACDSRGRCGEPSTPTGLMKKWENRSESRENDQGCSCGRGS